MERGRTMTIKAKAVPNPMKVRLDSPSEVDTYGAVMEQFVDDYNDNAKVAFFKRLPDQLAIFIR